jgi:hypothetical protein
MPPKAAVKITVQSPLSPGRRRRLAPGTPDSEMHLPEGRRTLGSPSRGRSPIRSPGRSPGRSPRKKDDKLGEEKKEEIKEQIAKVVIEPALDLAKAVVAGDIKAVLALITEKRIEHRLEFVNEIDRDGQTAYVLFRPPPRFAPRHFLFCVFVFRIFHALTAERLDILALLVDYGADLNARNDKRDTPLHAACALNNKKAVRLLVFNGADILSSNSEQNKPYQACTMHIRLHLHFTTPHTAHHRPVNHTKSIALS